MTVKLYAANAAALENKDLYDVLLKKLDSDRIVKTERYRFEKDKRLSLLAGALLMFALKEEGINQLPKIQYTENGKPFFSDCPGYRFNLSHSGTYALCAVADCELGCDIQTIDPIGLAIAEKYYTDREKQWVYSFPQQEQCRAFYRIWALKESFIKTTGEGLRLPLSDFSIVPQLDGFEFLPPKKYSEKSFSFYESTAISGYSCACCAETLQDNAHFNLLIVEFNNIIKKIL